MVEIADIDSLGRLEAWLNGQSHEVAVCIAPRAAAWVLPIWWHAVLSEDWARGREWTALTVLRCTLISYVAAKMPNEDIKRVASNAAATARTSASLASGAATHAAAAHAAFSAAFAASTAFSDEPVNTAFNAFAASINSASTAAAGSNNHSYSVSDPSTPAFAIWQSFRADASQMKDEEILVFMPLWQQGVGPFDGLWEKINGFVEGGDSPHDWQFWIEWYQALLDGRPMLGNAARTWEMLEKIALIKPEVWDQGPEAVNPMIHEIWDLVRLRIEAEELRAQKEAFLAERATPEQRSHNQPPGLVEAEPEIARQVTIIWAGLDEASEELAAKEPDKERLTQIAKGMLAALRAVAAYCGKLADRVIKAAASVIGAGVGTALLDHVANNGRLMQFAKDLLTWSVGGG